ARAEREDDDRRHAPDDREEEEDEQAALRRVLPARRLLAQRTTSSISTKVEGATSGPAAKTCCVGWIAEETQGPPKFVYMVAGAGVISAPTERTGNLRGQLASGASTCAGAAAVDVTTMGTVHWSSLKTRTCVSGRQRSLPSP